MRLPTRSCLRPVSSCDSGPAVDGPSVRASIDRFEQAEVSAEPGAGGRLGWGEQCRTVSVRLLKLSESGGVPQRLASAEIAALLTWWGTNASDF